MIKKTLLSTAALFALTSTSIQAENTFYDANPAPAYAPGTAGPYVGIGYSRASVDDDFVDLWTGDYQNISVDYDSMLLQAGYKYNPYIAFEFRYWFSVGNGDATTSGTLLPFGGYNDFDAWGIYLKPMYPITPEFNVYGLLGFSGTYVEGGPDWDILNDSSFSWGGGVSFDVTPHIEIFVDYVQLYDGSYYDYYWDTEQDTTLDSWNIGVNYKF